MRDSYHKRMVVARALTGACAADSLNRKTLRCLGQVRGPPLQGQRGRDVS